MAGGFGIISPTGPLGLPGVFIGKQVAVFVVQGQIANCDGSSTLQNNPPDLKLLGTMKRAKFMFHPQHEEISACTAIMENNIIIKDGITVDVDEITSIGGRSNMLVLAFQYNYFRLSFAANCLGDATDTTSPYTQIIMDLVRGDLGYEINPGESNTSLQLKSAGVPITSWTVQ